jgi:hypothetical protein
MARPFPYRDNQRSATLLADLADMDVGGETEFMLADPRPLMLAPPSCGGAACKLNSVDPSNRPVEWLLKRLRERLE